MNSLQPLKIEVIIGSTRENRFSEKPAKWIYEFAQGREGLEMELVDLRDYPLAFFDEPLSPMRLNGKYANEMSMRWAAKVAEADGYIIVSPEYNHGYSAVLKNAIDCIYPEWNRKAVGFVGYGNAGGARAVEQLRQVAVEMQMAPIKAAIHIPSTVYIAVIRPKEGDPANPFEALTDMATIFLDQLTWWTRALKVAREEEVKIEMRV
jgi:NAD(P)H-dependent FMN reductase